MNIDQMIESESFEQSLKYKRRKIRILNFLVQRTGYKHDKHSVEANKLINNHGLMKNRDEDSMKVLNSVNIEALK